MSDSPQSAAPAGDFPEWYTGLSSALDTKMGLEMLEVGAERTVGRMPVEGNTQPLGYWHGGATCVLAETLGSIASTAYGWSRGLVAMGVDINATHHRAARSGWITGTAIPVYLGSRLATYEVRLSNDDGELVASARLTCTFVKRG